MMIFKGKTILVIGGTGSLGKVFVKRVLSGELGTPKKIVVMSRDEAKQHQMRMEYLHKLVATDDVIYENFMNLLEFRIGDVRNYADVCAVVKNADIIINAAALKQVPACEYFPTQAVLTNCIGASNIVRAIEENSYPVDTVVAVSTDKACKPINVMGMTKAVQERIIIAANILNPKTRFICVRYGNVLASRGSVIPLFHEQIKNKGPVTVTVPGMTRFLLTLNQATDTIFSALRTAKPGETYVPIAPSAKIINIAKALIGKRNVKIKVINMRPAEKMHEIMFSYEDAQRCVKRGNYYVILPMLPELAQKDKNRKPALKKAFSSHDVALDLTDTTVLLKKHNLMVEDVDLTQKEELLR